MSIATKESIEHCEKHSKNYCRSCPLVGQCVAPVSDNLFGEWVESMNEKIRNINQTAN